MVKFRFFLLALIACALLTASASAIVAQMGIDATVTKQCGVNIKEPIYIRPVMDVGPDFDKQLVENGKVWFTLIPYYEQVGQPITFIATGKNNKEFDCDIYVDGVKVPSITLETMTTKYITLKIVSNQPGYSQFKQYKPSYTQNNNGWWTHFVDRNHYGFNNH